MINQNSPSNLLINVIQKIYNSFTGVNSNNIYCQEENRNDKYVNAKLLSQILEGDDDAGGCVHVSDKGRVLALPRLLLEVCGASHTETSATETKTLHPEATVLDRVPKMLQ